MIGQTVSHYEILEKLGAGGMGVVYKARDLKLDRIVALKFLPGYLGDEESDRVAHERFVQEAKAASALDHPHIANIHEIDETEDGQTFIVMSYYEGETLKKRIARGPLPIKESVDLVCQIAEGLAKAHGRGIVHRDIKPANVMVTSDGLVKIIDFGLAKLGDATRITKRGTAVGTMAYMSPEQAKGDAIDSRTDIWSLGVVLYEMLTGELPFGGDSDAAVLQGILNRSPRPVIDRREDIPDELERIASRALQKDPKARYASMEEVLKDLSTFKYAGARTRRLLRSPSTSAASSGDPRLSFR
jgi:serine/threonine-protein kinase